MNENFFLCTKCCKDVYLKHYVLHNSINQDKTCTICQENFNVINIAENPRLNEFCRFLIRYHYPEYEYNPKWGGNGVNSLLTNQNDIISNHFFNHDTREEEIELFVEELFNLNQWPFHDLYYGSDELGKSLFGSSIKNDGSYYWRRYKDKLKETNHYLLKDEATDMFKNIIGDFKFQIPIGSDYFRARIGYDTETEDPEGIPIVKKVPFKSAQISAPPIFSTAAGRLNRQGVSYLYLASSQDIALGEVRPHPGHYVSIGKFKSKSDLLLADFRFINLFDYFDDENNLKSFLFLEDLSKELSQTVLPNESEQYLITQFLSDMIRDLKYDGIIFNSSVSNGYNLLVFDSTKFEYVENSSELLKVKMLTYEVGIVQTIVDGFILYPIEILLPRNNINDQ